MVELSDSQKKSVSSIVAFGLEADVFPSVLLHGPCGSGKRTIAKAVAREWKLDFVEVNVNGPVHEVAARLIGGTGSSTVGGLPGALADESGALVYMSGLQHSARVVWDVIALAARNRTYHDGRGIRKSIAEVRWIVCGLDTDVDEAVAVDPDHWLCAQFDYRVGIEAPSDCGEARAIALSILAAIGGAPPLDEELAQNLAPHISAPDHLHGFRRTLERAAQLARGKETIGDVDMQRAMEQETERLVRDLRFRGTAPSASHVSLWLGQFPGPLRATARAVLRALRRDYFFGEARYFEILQRLIERAEIPERSRVAFGTWQNVGSSAPAIAHDLKNQARWTTIPDIDLRRPESWPSNEVLDGTTLVVADDFVGSGDTLTSLVEGSEEPVIRFLESRPATRLRILIVAGYRAGLQAVDVALRRFGPRARLIPGQVFGDEDRCFHARSRILQSPIGREAFRRFCLDVGYSRLRLSDEYVLGYKEIAALVVFFNTVPNCTLPIIWADRETWRSLFPAAGRIEETGTASR